MTKAASYQLAINIFKFLDDMYLISFNVPFQCVLGMPVLSKLNFKIVYAESIDFQEKICYCIYYLIYPEEGVAPKGYACTRVLPHTYMHTNHKL